MSFGGGGGGGDQRLVGGGGGGGGIVTSLVTSTCTTTGHGGSVVSALASQAKGRGSIPSCGTSFFSQKYFYLPFPTSVE